MKLEVVWEDFYRINVSGKLSSTESIVKVSVDFDKFFHEVSKLGFTIM